MTKNTVKCPVCGALEQTEEGGYERCHVCGWDDDWLSRNDPDGPSFHATLSLNEAKKAWKNGEQIREGYPNPTGKENEVGG